MLGTQRVGGIERVASFHLGLTPSWSAWSPAVSGAFVFDPRTLDTVSGDP